VSHVGCVAWKTKIFSRPEPGDGPYLLRIPDLGSLKVRPTKSEKFRITYDNVIDLFGSMSVMRLTGITANVPALIP